MKRSSLIVFASSTLESERVIANPHVLSFFFNVSPSTELYTLSLHDALPICSRSGSCSNTSPSSSRSRPNSARSKRSEEHTSELQSRGHLVCRLLLEKKKNVNPPSCI